MQVDDGSACDSGAPALYGHTLVRRGSTAFTFGGILASGVATSAVYEAHLGLYDINVVRDASSAAFNAAAASVSTAAQVFAPAVACMLDDTIDCMDIGRALRHFTQEVCTVVHHDRTLCS